ncbi:hypothetical protein ACFVJI_32045 [Streptomyces sp. NPDC127584]|uniref:hypothetical protein n=1 Tax=Streptomyces sp. NPDC127584 TaxID=3345403 RepID=UPI00364094E4
MAAIALPVRSEPQDGRTRELLAALDPEFLRLVGWDWDLGLFFYPREHPVLGMRECEVEGCENGFERTGPLCSGCRLRWNQSGLDLEEFLLAANRGNSKNVRQELCRFPECRRPWRSPSAALCQNHHYQRRERLRVTLEEFLAQGHGTGTSRRYN